MNVVDVSLHEIDGRSLEVSLREIDGRSLEGRTGAALRPLMNPILRRGSSLLGVEGGEAPLVMFLDTIDETMITQSVVT
jgi:hypothetical protein